MVKHSIKMLVKYGITVVAKHDVRVTVKHGITVMVKHFVKRCEIWDHRCSEKLCQSSGKTWDHSCCKTLMVGGVVKHGIRVVAKH